MSPRLTRAGESSLTLALFSTSWQTYLLNAGREPLEGVEVRAVLVFLTMLCVRVFLEN